MTIVPVAAKTSPIDVTIANAASLSAAVALGGLVVVGVVMPAAWTTAGLTFQASTDGTTFFDLYDASGEVGVDVAASQFIAVSPATWAGVTWLKVRSGTSGVPVAQGAARALTLIGRAID